MEQLLNFITGCMVTVAIYYMFFLVYGKLYVCKYNSKKIYVITYLLCVGIAIIVSQAENPVINIITTCLLINIIGIFLYQEKLKKKLIYNNFIIVLVYFCDIVSVAIWIFIKNSSFKEILLNYQVKAICCMLNILFLYLAYRIILSVLCKRKMSEVKKKEVMLIVFMTVFEMFIVQSYMMKSATRMDGFVVLIMLVCFLLVNIFITYLLEQISKVYSYQYELDSVKRQNELQLMHYQEISRQYQESRKIMHDIKKHLALLSSLKGEDEQRAEQYQMLIEEQIKKFGCGFKCTNQILSIIMGQKISLARSESIKIKTNMQDCPLEFLEDMDITAIFANLWDNAIEACRKVQEEKRYISVYMKQKSGVVILDVENSFDGIVHEQNKKILSTKHEHEGLGLTIIRETVEKYDGIFMTRHTGDIFHSEIVIPVTS